MKYEDFGELPDWAIGKTNKYMVVGAQLRTRDGRVTGNARVESIDEDGLATIRTDAGTVAQLTERELSGMFHRPEWIMKRIGPE